jgi:diguanylate cyclase (GGDEF)-like protein
MSSYTHATAGAPDPHAGSAEEPGSPNARLVRLIKANQTLRKVPGEGGLPQQIVEAAWSALGFERAALYESLPESGKMRLSAQKGDNSSWAQELSVAQLDCLLQERWRYDGCSFIPQGRCLPAEGDLPRTNNKPPRYDANRNKDPTPQPWQPGDVLLAVVKAGGQEQPPLGVLLLEKPADGLRPSRSQLAMVELFASQAGMALENIRLSRDSHRYSQGLEVLHQVSQEMVAARPDPENVYQAVHRAAQKLMPCECFVIILVNRERGCLEGVYLVDRGGRAPVEHFPLGDGLSGIVINNNQSLYIPDVHKDDKTMQLSKHFGSQDVVRSILFAPLHLGEEVIGCISAQSYTVDTYSHEDLLLLEMFASYAATALSNARMFYQLQHMAITDSLTNLYNRRYFYEVCEREFTRSLRYKREMSVVLMDLDYFKQVNDVFGHLAGDRVLAEVARRIQACLRTVDTVGRFGGEEFVALLPETGLQSALVVAERIRSQVGSQTIKVGEAQVNVTLSAGVASLQQDTSSVDDLLARADAALYHSKHLGRNGVQAG